MDERPTLIRSTVDLDAAGRHCGFLRLPFSSDRSAYGVIPVPIVTIRGGEGPVVLLIGGNHGDEYEGPVALMELIRTLDPAEVQGQVIILPAANLPAVMAAARVSPVDAGNLNREFPGSATGSPTQMIAHYISTVLAPRADFALDIHSGGTSLHYLPTLLSGSPPKEPEARRKHREHIEAIGLDNTLLFRTGGQTGGRNLGSSVRARGGTAFACEIGGSAQLTPETIAQARGVLRRFLAMAGVWAAPEVPAPVATRLLANSAEDYLYASDNGLFAPSVELGATVQEGDDAGYIHFPDTPWREPVRLTFERGGVIVCMRPIAQCERGDCLFQLGTPWSDALD